MPGALAASFLLVSNSLSALLIGAILPAVWLALNTVPGEREWKSSDRSVVMRVCAGSTFTRGVCVLMGRYQGFDFFPQGVVIATGFLIRGNRWENSSSL